MANTVDRILIIFDRSACEARILYRCINTDRRLIVEPPFEGYEMPTVTTRSAALKLIETILINTELPE